MYVYYDAHALQHVLRGHGPVVGSYTCRKSSEEVLLTSIIYNYS